MPKKIPCACAQGYHYSKTEKTKCRRSNGFLSPSSLSIVELKTQHIHPNRCGCPLCQEIRLERLISYFSLPINRCRLLSQSEISSDQLVDDHKQTTINQQNAEERLILWDEQKILALMEKGVGSVNSKVIEAIKSHRLRYRRNQTFLRMYLFLNPRTSIIVQNWKAIVKPNQLMLKAEQSIDMRSYRQRVQDRLSSLAKKYKQLCINSKTHFRTAQMMQIEVKMDHLTEIMTKFYFIEDYSDPIAVKQCEAWEKNIVILKKGDCRPQQINSFKELKAISPFFQPPIRKEYKLHLIDKKQHLDRVYEQVRRKAKYYGLIERSSKYQQFELLQEVSRKKFIDNQKMELEQPLINLEIKHMQTMSMQFSHNTCTSSIFTCKFNKNIIRSYGRSYLSPRICIKDRNNPLTVEEIAHMSKKIMNQSWIEQQSLKMISENTKSKEFSSMTVFFAEKSLAQSDWFPEKMQVEQLKPSVRQFEYHYNSEDNMHNTESFE